MRKYLLFIILFPNLCLSQNIYNPYFHNFNNIQNLSFIFELSKQLKLKNKFIYKSINSFKGLSYRQQIIKKSKNT